MVNKNSMQLTLYIGALRYVVFIITFGSCLCVAFIKNNPGLTGVAATAICTSKIGRKIQIRKK